MSDTFRLILLALILPIASYGAQVIEVASDGKSLTISQSQDALAFLPNDYLCVLHEKEEVACGLVKESLENKAILSLDFSKEPISQGDKVVYAGNRYPASLVPPATGETSFSISAKRKVYPFDLSVGMLVGAHYFIPTAHFQGMISPKVSLGILPTLYRRPLSSPTLDAIGGFFTFNYYFNRYFRGPWLTAAAGFYAFSANGTRRTTSGAALLQLGYRFGLFAGLNCGLALGGQYLNRPRTAGETFNFSEFQAIASADLGWNF